MKKKIFTFLILLPIKVFATPIGTVVYDPTNALNMTNQAVQLKESIQYNKQMMESIGKGELTPGVINYLDRLYTQCGGKKYAIK